jgi:hypothetical protein
MPSYSLALDRASVVVLGRFNPIIFHPAWFARYALIRDAEAAQAKELVVTENAANFKVEWLDVQVTTQRFQVLTDDSAHSAPLRDLAVSVLTLLEHTHIWAIGINRLLHYKLESEEQWHRFGDLLAPKAHWRKLLSQPGMRSLTIEGGVEDAPNARVQCRVEPSRRVHPGVYFSLNEHHARAADNDAASNMELTTPDVRRELLELLAKRWTPAQSYAVRMAESLLGEEY